MSERDGPPRGVKRGSEAAGLQKPPDAKRQAQASQNQIVCQLCRRRFATQNELDRHLSHSTLHKENLRDLF